MKYKRTSPHLQGFDRKKKHYNQLPQDYFLPMLRAQHLRVTNPSCCSIDSKNVLERYLFPLRIEGFTVFLVQIVT